MAVIGGFPSDLSITRKTDGNFGNVSAGVVFSKELLPWSQRLSCILSFLFGNLRREALIDAPSPREKKASGQDR